MVGVAHGDELILPAGLEVGIEVALGPLAAVARGDVPENLGAPCMFVGDSEPGL